MRDIDWTHIEDARRIALDKGAGAIATLPHGLRLVVGYGEFVVGDEERTLPQSDIPQLDVECVPLPTTGTVVLPESDWTVETATLPAPHPKGKEGWGWVAVLDAQKITGGLTLRRRRVGDRFQPEGMSGHSKSLHEFMIDEKIPRAVRERLPLLADKEKILWVCGYRVDERVRVSDETRKVLQVTFRKNLSTKAAN